MFGVMTSSSLTGSVKFSLLFIGEEEHQRCCLIMITQQWMMVQYPLLKMISQISCGRQVTSSTESPHLFQNIDTLLARPWASENAACCYIHIGSMLSLFKCLLELSLCQTVLGVEISQNFSTIKGDGFGLLALWFHIVFVQFTDKKMVFLNVKSNNGLLIKHPGWKNAWQLDGRLNGSYGAIMANLGNNVNS